ncbi:MAG TPA: COQ9 family protein [Rhizomicrobium sp.]|nr:COQ9 family protein [Rhizomicrobium sp.]
MTAKAEKAREPRTRRGAKKDPKLAVLSAALAHVPFDGFTDKVLEQAAREAGVPADTLARLFPEGPLSLVEAFSDQVDAEMTQKLSKVKLSNLKVRERIATAVKLRLVSLRPHKEAARRAAAFLTLPPHATTGMKLLYRTVDAIWRGIGDTSTDFNFYTKRAILAAVYSTTLMRWFSDTGEDEHVTDEFLRHRIDDVMRFEKFKSQLRERASGWPSISEFLNPAGSASRRPGARGA